VHATSGVFGEFGAGASSDFTRGVIRALARGFKRETPFVLLSLKGAPSHPSM
jgi:hypothetical protein